MKLFAISMLVASFALFSCGNDTGSGAEQAGTDTVVTGLEGTRDQQGQMSGVKIDTTSGQQSAGGSSDSLNSSTEQSFIVDQVQGNYNEVALAGLAIKKSADKEIKSIATQLEKDHKAVLADLKTMASKGSYQIANAPSADATSKIADLEKRKGAEFDKAWTETLIDKHKSGIAKFENAEKSVSNPELKSFISQTLPKLRMHLDKLMAYHGQIK